MEKPLLSECKLLEDLFQPLLVISENPIPQKALETLIEDARTADGREFLASKNALLSALQICQNISYASLSHVLFLTLKLIRNLCAGDRINQVLFITSDGVGIILSTLDAMGVSLSKFVVIRMAIQVLANVSLGGEMQQLNIWSRFFPEKFLELARVRKRETCDPLCMVIYTCCNENGLFDELVGDRGLPLMEEIIRTASDVGVEEHWFKLLLSKICFQENYFPKLFSSFFPGKAPENGQDANSSGAIFGNEQVFLLGILNDVDLHGISIPIDFASAILEIFTQAIEESCVLMRPASVDVLAYSLLILRDICAIEKESMNGVVNLLLSSGLIGFLLSLLENLEPPEMIKKAMKQSENKEGTSSKSFNPCLYKGFRRDIVSVIANCAFQRKCVQDEVRERNGIFLLMQHCVTDEDNPFLREWGIFAMRNLLDRNVENQKCVEELKLQGSVDVPELNNFGMKVEIDPITRRPKLVNIP